MITHCQICGREFWLYGVEPISGDPRYCQECAITACEQMSEKKYSIGDRVVSEDGIGVVAIVWDDGVVCTTTNDADHPNPKIINMVSNQNGPVVITI